MQEQLNSKRLWTSVVAFLLLGIPAVLLRVLLMVSDVHVDPLIASLIFGLGIVAGAFLLSWAAEVAQLDVSASFAIAVLALIAILPEYAIEAVLAWDAGASFNTETKEVTEEMARVAANVTGANRLLIGLGWSAVILIYWYMRRRTLDMRGELGLELPMLTIATLVVLIIFAMQQVHVILAVGLIGLYIAYLWISSTREVEEPDLIGAAMLIGSLPAARRRAMVVFLFIYSAGIILVAAEPFVEGLIETGTEFGIDQFVLIQWVAPLASESPEIIVAVLFSLRANPMAGMTALISSEVNQLTLLIGSMVVVFSMSAGEVLSFGLDDRQSIEFLVTAGVSIFAVLLIAKRKISWRTGAILLVLFIAHLFYPTSSVRDVLGGIADSLPRVIADAQVRLVYALVYFGLAGVLILMDWRRVKFLYREEPQELE